MDAERLASLLDAVARGDVTPAEAGEFISHLPVQVRPIEFVLVGAFAIFVCLMATIWPAVHASRLRPAEAFREG